jgi:hypothetical protein
VILPDADEAHTTELEDQFDWFTVNADEGRVRTIVQALLRSILWMRSPISPLQIQLFSLIINKETKT